MSKVSRRTFLTSSAGVLLAARSGLAQGFVDGAAAKGMVTADAQRAIDRGLAYLERRQANDGSWGERPEYAGNVAVVALGGLAFMAGGHQPGRGPYGKVVTRAIRYVLEQEQSSPPGFLHHRAGSMHGPMYGHGFGTMFLGEVHGMVPDRDLRRRVRDVLSRAVQVILNAQNDDGGWRYQPRPENADISVTVCQIMALRSARNAGLDVPKATVDRCIKYVRDCQNSSDGGFRYFRQGGLSGFPRSAAGVAALHSAGIYKDPAIERGLKYLMQFKPAAQSGFRRDSDLHYLYGHYYAAQVMWTAGGRWWSEWFPAIRDDLVGRSRIRSDGAWFDPTVGADYATAMATIILQIPNNYLPIMQK